MSKERILCPNCGASYRITVKMLQKAGQEARCAVCKEVFTINVQDVEFSPDNEELSAENVIKQLRASERRERNRRKARSLKSDPPARPEKEEERERKAPTFRVQAPDDATPAAPRLTKSRKPVRKTTSERVLDITSATESAHQRILSGQPQPTIKKKQPIALWLVGSVVLVITMFSQTAWLMRDNPVIYNQIVAACKVMGCQPPELRNPKSISIADRLFTAIKNEPGTFQLQLNIRNHAPYPQPFPTIELSLLDSNGEVKARNKFSVEQYLAENEERIMQPSRDTNIEFMVHTPSRDTTGFMLDFL